jgi:hypothetical protein
MRELKTTFEAHGASALLLDQLAGAFRSRKILQPEAGGGNTGAGKLRNCLNCEL